MRHAQCQKEKLSSRGRGSGRGTPQRTVDRDHLLLSRRFRLCRRARSRQGGPSTQERRRRLAMRLAGLDAISARRRRGNAPRAQKEEAMLKIYFVMLDVLKDVKPMLGE